MTTIKTHKINKIKTLSPIAICVALGLSNHASAVEFKIGDANAVLNSQISIGSSWRVENPDSALLKDVYGNYGNNDDANNNFKKGDTFSEIVKGVHDLEVSYDNIGFFVRGKYWYDRQLDKGDVYYGHVANLGANGIPGAPLDYNQPNQPLNDANFDPLAKASGIALLDAFVYGEFELGEMPLDVRLGKQVINWGEANFIRGPLNSINPVDTSALRRPGATVKEALLPVNMAFASLGLTDNLSTEVFYQIGYEESALDACGTYFSFTDYVTPGCNSISLSNGATSIARNEDGIKYGDDGNQAGIAFRYYAEELAGTEFGAYFMNIQERLPIVSFTKHTIGQAQMQQLQQQGMQIWQQFGPMSGYDSPQELITALVTQARISTSSYITDYSNENQVMGLTFATNLAGFSISGEYTRVNDQAIQINGPVIVSAILSENTTSEALNERVRNTELGGYVSGSDSFDVSQFQVTAINTYFRVLGASQIAVIGEVGYSHIHGFHEGPDATKYGRSGIFGTFNQAPASVNPGSIDDGFITQASWGYRALISASYTDVFAGVNINPSIAWAHDVSGTSAQPSGNFIEGNKKLTLNLAASYRDTYTASVAYTQFSGDDFSIIRDRDFMSVNFSVSF
jgi:hypothetical protein